MRTFLIVLLVFLSISSPAQDSLRGRVLSVIDSTAIPHFLIRINKKSIITTDAEGNFCIPIKNGKLRLASIFGFHGFDTTIFRKPGERLLLYSAKYYDPALAHYDLQHATVLLFCGVAIAPMAPLKSDKEFESKYQVHYYIVGDFLPSSVAQMTSYNLVVADYLDRRYGKKWRAELRSDVLGIFRPASSQQSFGISETGRKSSQQ